MVVLFPYPVSYYAYHMCFFLLCEVRNIIDSKISTTLLVRTSNVVLIFESMMYTVRSAIILDLKNPIFLKSSLSV